MTARHCPLSPSMRLRSVGEVYYVGPDGERVEPDDIFSNTGSGDYQETFATNRFRDVVFETGELIDTVEAIRRLRLERIPARPAWQSGNPKSPRESRTCGRR